LKLLLSHIQSPLGTILLVSDGEFLRALDFHDYEPRMHQLLRLHYGSCTLTPPGNAGALGRSVQAYFEGELTALDAVPVRTGGTAFQRSVWDALRLIPPGVTTTYGRLAAQLGRVGASRAVGMANGANPVSIVVPCHRVIGANSALTGYGGGLHRKGVAHRPRTPSRLAGTAAGDGVSSLTTLFARAVAKPRLLTRDFDRLAVPDQGSFADTPQRAEDGGAIVDRSVSSPSHAEATWRGRARRQSPGGRRAAGRGRPASA